MGGGLAKPATKGGSVPLAKLQETPHCSTEIADRFLDPAVYAPLRSLLRSDLYTNAESLWEALNVMHGEVLEVRLLRSSWLLQRATERLPLPRRQDLERDHPGAANPAVLPQYILVMGSTTVSPPSRCLHLSPPAPTRGQRNWGQTATCGRFAHMGYARAPGPKS